MNAVARLSALGGALSVAAGCVVLAAWALDIHALKSILPGLATMKVNTAVCFVLLGLALYLFHAARGPRPVFDRLVASRAARLIALGVIVVAGTTLAEDVMGWNLGIDELLRDDLVSAASGAQAPGRMSQATATCFVALGASLLFLMSESVTFVGVGQSLAAGAGLVAGVALLGYLLFVPALYGVQAFSTMALHTAALMLALATALVVARTERGWARIWFAGTASARMGRQMLVATLVLVPAFGWLAWAGVQGGLFQAAFGNILVIAFSIAAITAIIWLTTRRASREEESARRLSRIYEVLGSINALIMRTHDRTQLLEETCRIAVDAGEFPFVWTGIVDFAALRVVPIAWAGDHRGFLDIVAERLSLRNGSAPVARAVTEAAPVISTDVRAEADSPYRDALLERGVRSFAILPMLKEGDAIGVIAVHAGVPDFFDDAELKLLMQLAGDVAFSLDHIEKEERLNHLAYFNTLTNLANRTLFLDRVGQHVRGAARADGRLALALFDVAGFKAINDAYGRNCGDEVLREIGRRMEQRADEPSYLARIEADRFAAVMPKVQDERDVVRACERFTRECFDPPLTVDGRELRLSARVGVALYPRDGRDADSLFHNAEAALKQAKSSGERLLFYAPEINADLHARLEMETGLRRALELDEFVLHYQPKVEAGTREIVGLEALLRWRSGNMGLVPPARFIGLLEETGLIVDVGAWVLRQAVADRRRFAEAGVSMPRIAVNVSSVQLRRPDFVDAVQAALAQDTSPPGLDLEITESGVMQDVQAAIATLQAVANLGVGIAIDDFGTGYSSLAYLAKLPARTLKIDRSFVDALLREQQVAMLISSVISMAHALGMQVTAEGVESEDQARVLHALGCDELQGYLIGRPLPLEEMLAVMKRATA